MATKAEITALVKNLEGGYMTQCSKWTRAQWAQVYHRWHEVLGPVPLPLLEAASKYCALTEKWFPQPSQIVDALVTLRRMTTGVPDKVAAWREARRLAAKRCWREDDELVARDVQEADCSHPMVYQAIQSFGLRELRASDNSAPDRKHFWDTYERLCRREEEADVVTALLPEVEMGKMLPATRERIAGVVEARRA